tara:strand:- start:827 stop:1063 length:237 start_codon:yes stop_codon:yes gene_type:complete
MIYCILNIADLDNVDYSEVGEDSSNTVRKNLAKTQFLIKWEDLNTPEFITDKSIVPVETLSYAEALILLMSDTWSEED